MKSARIPRLVYYRSMKTVEVYLLKSFGINSEGGNPAGVVLNAESLTDEEKLYISSAVGFSETAFVQSSERADFKVTFFTPNSEVDLCGHATIAVYSLLWQKQLLSPGKYTQELKAGLLGIEIGSDGFVWMDQTQPVFSEIINLQEINKCVSNSLTFDKLKPQIVSTGLRDILLPIDTLEELNSLSVDHEKLSLLNQQTNTIGLHAFTLEVINDGSVAHTRNFAPLFGIKEESATGSSNGALAAYLFKNGMLENHDLNSMRFEQGYAMKEPSEIFSRLMVLGGDIQRIQVGGRAVLFGQKSLEF